MERHMEQQQAEQKINFSTYFTSKVAPAAEKIEKYRKKIITLAAIYGGIICTIFILIAVSVLVFPSKLLFNEKLLCAALFIFVPILCFICGPLFTIKKIYNIFTKEILIPRLLGFWGKFAYFPPANIFTAIYKSIKNKTGFKGIISELRGAKQTNISINPTILARLLKFSSISYDDKIVGKHADTDIELTELETYYMTKERDREGKTSYQKRTTFKGVVFSATMNKKFKGLTVLSYSNIDKNRAQYPHVTKKEIGAMNLSDVLNFGRQVADVVDLVKEYQQGKSKEELEQQAKNSSLAQKAVKTEPLQDVMLEDPMFNKKFKMCSTDQVEARYIFTTGFMERFMKMGECFNYKIKAIFLDNNVYILIDQRKDWFQIPFFKSGLDPANYKQFLIEFSRLLSIVEVLKLNQNIGM